MSFFKNIKSFLPLLKKVTNCSLQLLVLTVLKSLARVIFQARSLKVRVSHDNMSSTREKPQENNKARKSLQINEQFFVHFIHRLLQSHKQSFIFLCWLTNEDTNLTLGNHCLQDFIFFTIVPAHHLSVRMDDRRRVSLEGRGQSFFYCYYLVMVKILSTNHLLLFKFSSFLSSRSGDQPVDTILSRLVFGTH